MNAARQQLRRGATRNKSASALDWANPRGFSLIELMVTVAILLMVMAGVFGEVGKMQKVSRDEDLKRELRGQKATLVWDGLPAQKSRVMMDYLRRQRGWLAVERLPATRRT